MIRMPAPAGCLADPAVEAIDPERALLATQQTPGRAVPGNHPALGSTRLSGHPVLLLEPAEAFTIVEPASGHVREIQAEILVRQGFQRLQPDHAEPGRLAGWSLIPAGGHLQVHDERNEVWAYTSARPAVSWLAEAARLGSVLVVYGALVGVRAPRGVAAVHYGTRQRAAELAAGRARGFVAAARLNWVS
jgi:hypothetical protein